MALVDFLPGKTQLLTALARVALKLEGKAHAIDADAGGEMVEQMRATVQVDSGTLLNGIRTYEEDGVTIVEASAVRDGFDYAFTVERGRHADANFYEAEPFFFPAVEEVLEERGEAMDDVIDIISGEEGFA